ncbi:hypothetical protein WMF20_19595 [Sorangium sp. So ce834]
MLELTPAEAKTLSQCVTRSTRHAKATEKGRSATVDGELFRPEDLVLA